MYLSRLKTNSMFHWYDTRNKIYLFHVITPNYLNRVPHKTWWLFTTNFNHEIKSVCLLCGRIYHYWALIYKNSDNDVYIVILCTLYLYAQHTGTKYNISLVFHVVLRKYASLPFNLIKPTGHVMHHQFNIQHLYALPTLFLCVLYLSENKPWLVPLTA
jgi:hypothetical protein